MVTVRLHPDSHGPASAEPTGCHPGGGHVRFNVLITRDRPYAGEHWTNQLPRLLEPQGVAAYVAGTGREAIGLAEQVNLHAAVIDMATPLGPHADESAPSPIASQPPAGMWILQLFHRLPKRPPVVVVHNHVYSQRQIARLLHDALRLGVFSVLSKPVELEQLLSVFQRLMDRQYAGAWPKNHGPRRPDQSSSS